jgi:indolepyruvate decarboxylase
MEKCVIDEGHPQFAGMYAGAASDPKARQIAEGADLVLDLRGVNLNDITTAAYSAQLDRSRFITVGLNDVRIGRQRHRRGAVGGRVLAEMTKLKPSLPRYQAKPQGLAPVTGNPSNKITMDALYPRYAAFLRPRDTVGIETGSRGTRAFGSSGVLPGREVVVGTGARSIR